MSGIPLVHPFGEPPKIRSPFDWAQGERIFGGSTALFRINVLFRTRRLHLHGGIGNASRLFLIKEKNHAR
jgi:hypothetical protein